MSAEGHDGWVEIARLLRPQGRRGELLAEPLTDVAEVFRAGLPMRLLRDGKPAGTDMEDLRTLEAFWRPSGRNAGRIVLKLAGVDSISSAEMLMGCTAAISADIMPALEDGTYFVRDLVGSALWNGDRRVGDITGVEFAVAADGRTRLEDAAPLLAVRKAKDEADIEAADDGTVLVPFVRAWIDEVDLGQKRVTMHLPEGLVDG